MTTPSTTAAPAGTGDAPDTGTAKAGRPSAHGSRPWPAAV